jgi:hypothetical protein
VASSFMRFLDHTQWCSTVSRTPGRVISPLQRYLPGNTHNRQTSCAWWYSNPRLQ